MVLPSRLWCYMEAARETWQTGTPCIWGSISRKNENHRKPLFIVMGLRLYFDQPSAVNRSMLKPCADTNLYNDLMMSAYLSASGDTDGVVVQPDGKVVGKCPGDGYFWLSPSCRSDPTKCVLYITGGGGYGLSGVLQRATRWNIPLAFGVGATWGDFVSVVNTKKSMFDWRLDGWLGWFCFKFYHSQALRSPSTTDIQLVAVN